MKTKRIIAMTMAMVMSLAVQAANLWDGGGANDNWNTGANWDDNAVPTFPVGLSFGGATRLTPSNDLSSLTVNGITFNNGAGAFVIGGNAITLGGNIVNNDADIQTINLDMTMDATRTVTTTTGNIVLGGNIDGVGGLTMTGTKTLTLSGSNSFSGPVTLTGGTLNTGSDTAFGTGQVTFNGGKWGAANNVVITNNIAFNNNMTGNSLGRTTEFTGQFTGTGSLFINGFAAGVVKLSGDNSGWSGNWNFQGENKLQLNHTNALGTGTDIIFDNVTAADKSRGVLESQVVLTGVDALTQNISLGVNSYSNNTATIQTTANMEQTGVISGEAGTRLIKTGAGKLFLDGANTYAGGTLVSSGIVIANTNTAFGTGDVEFNGGQWNSGAGSVIANNIILSSTAVGNALSAPTEFTGQFSGSGDFKINGFASGIVKLSGDNSGWSGNWVFTGRNKLQLNHVNALGTGTTVTFNKPGTAGYSRGVLESLVDLTGSNALVQDINLGLDSGLTGNAATITTTANLDLAGVVSGAESAKLIKNGVATLTFDQANTYAGGTEVQAGTLVGNADGAFGTNDISVANGATLVMQGGTSNDYIGDLADLVLGTNASLTLNFTGTDSINSLSLDGGTTTVSDGTYTAAALSGLGTGTYTGTGSLAVGAGGSAYDTWAGGWGVALGTSTDDYDNDGLLNIYEYGLGGDPTNSTDQGTSPVFGMQNVGGTNYFGYIHPQLKAVDSGISYKLALTTDLVNTGWTTNSGYVVLGTNVPVSGEFDFVTNVTTTVEGKKFIKLIIE
ncbi:MAG: autotransporter-associated beta strand repeat-containing protein [Kiritimatiellales bacterium]|nr:autotransporter-associated beta strand repeat-containing protein [Kiritimatiellales bacterium]